MEHFFFHRMEFIVGILFFYYIRLLHIFCLLWPFNIYPSLISTEKKKLIHLLCDFMHLKFILKPKNKKIAQFMRWWGLYKNHIDIHKETEK